MEKHDMVRYSCAFVFVKDIAASKKFYTTLLERKIVDDHGRHVIFKGGLALIDGHYAHNVIFGKKTDEENFGRNNLEIYFEVTDLDLIFQRLMKEGVTFIHAIVEQPWGQRVFRFYDPDMHVIEIGEPISEVILRYEQKGMKAEEISEKTSMAHDTIIKILAERGLGSK